MPLGRTFPVSSSMQVASDAASSSAHSPASAEPPLLQPHLLPPASPISAPCQPTPELGRGQGLGGGPDDLDLPGPLAHVQDAAARQHPFPLGKEYGDR